MSYQFEDDSALEELLNQQLNQRRRQQPPVSSSTSRRLVSQQQRPSTAIISESLEYPETNQTGSAVSLEPAKTSKGKLASWLDGGAKEVAETRAATSESARGSVISTAKPARVQDHDDEYDVDNDEVLYNEDRLQGLSKQRLVQLVTSKLKPRLRELKNQEHKHQSRLHQLQMELDDVKSQLNVVRGSEVTLREQVEKQTASLRLLDVEHRRQLEQLAEGYQKQLAEEKAHYELTLKRRDEFHQLELGSKLRANIEIRELESTFSEWQRMIKDTLEEMNSQYKTVESLIGKQSVEISGSNSQLANKTRALVEAHERFEKRGEQLDRLATQLGDFLGQISAGQSKHEQLLEISSQKLEQLIESEQELRSRESRVETCQNQLASEREQLSQEKLQVAMEVNKIEFKQQRLDGLLEANELQQKRLDQSRCELEARDTEARQLRQSLDLQASQLRDQNYQLHLARRKLVDREQHLVARQVQVEEQRARVDSRVAKLKQKLDKLGALRTRVGRELSQLRRLESSLICSICNESLSAEMGKTLVPHDKGPLTSEWLKSELADLMGRMELDGRRLEAENNYVDGLTQRLADDLPM